MLLQMHRYIRRLLLRQVTRLILSNLRLPKHPTGILAQQTDECRRHARLLFPKRLQFRSDPADTLAFLKRLSATALSKIRRIRFLFEDGDLTRWNKANYKPSF